MQATNEVGGLRRSFLGPDLLQALGPALPSIAGFDRRYTLRVLQEYRSGEREGTIMDRIMKGYTPAQMRHLANYYAEQSWEDAAIQPNLRVATFLRDARSLPVDRNQDDTHLPRA